MGAGVRALVALLALTACAADPAPRPTAAPTTAAPTTAAPTTTPPPDEDRDFVTPSGNIACSLSVGYTSCTIRDRAWEPPGTRCGTRPVTVGFFDGHVETSCDDLGAFASSYLLAYGESMAVGGITCTSDRAGVTCRARGGKGFTVSRAKLVEH